MANPDIALYASKISTTGLQTGTATAVTTLITAAEGAGNLWQFELLQKIAEFIPLAVAAGI